MKIKKVFFGLATASLAVAALASCGGGENPNPTQGGNSTGGDNSTGGGASDSYKYEAKIWVSESQGVKELTEQQIDEFNKANPDIAIKATVEGQSESDSATAMITDVTTGADIFCFAQDQMNRLVTANALSKLGTKASEFVAENNDEYSVAASKVNGQIYCYPITSDNGYFMMYDKSVITEDIVDDLEAIVAKCEETGRNFSMENETSGWYSASWFFATGCTQDWTTSADGKFVSVNDTFNSEEGIIAMRGMQHLVKSPAYVSSSAASDFGAAVPSAVVITGTWGVNEAKSKLGDNYAATDLPSFHVDGKAYHLGSFNGFKLMGVKPQTDAAKGAALHKLAQYLSSEKAQLERFDTVGWGPSNKAAAATDKVKNDAALKALADQMPFAKAQGQIHGSWWDLSKTYAQGAKDADKDDVNALQAALDKYKESIDGLFSMSDEELRAFTVIGSLNGTGWGTDFDMEEISTNVWVSKDVFTLTAADITAGNNEFKCRQGKSWDVNFGDNGENFKITEAGKYKIKLTFDGTNGTIELIAQ